MGLHRLKKTERSTVSHALRFSVCDKLGRIFHGGCGAAERRGCAGAAAGMQAG